MVMGYAMCVWRPFLSKREEKREEKEGCLNSRYQGFGVNYKNALSQLQSFLRVDMVCSNIFKRHVNDLENHGLSLP